MRADSTDYIYEDKLLDGRSIAIRAIHPDDRVNLQDIWQHLSEQSKYYRFFVPKKELSDQELTYYSEIDFSNHVGLLAIVIENGVQVPVGVGRYIVSDESGDRPVAGGALTVEDDYHALGIGTLLLTHLTEIARAKGIEEFRAFVLTENRKMREVFQHCGLPMKTSLGLSGVVEIRLGLTCGTGSGMSDIPSIFFLTAGAAIVAVVGFMIVHRVIKPIDLDEHQGFLDAMLNIVGTLVSILALHSPWIRHLMPILLICSAIVLAFAYLYVRRGAVLHGVLICFVAVALGGNLGLVFLLSNPFSGDWKIQPRGFELNRQILQKLQSSPELRKLLESNKE